MDKLIVIVVICFIILFLYKEWVRPAVVFIIGVSVLTVTQIITPSEILEGFANEQLAVIILLLILGDIVQRTQVLNRFFDRLFQKATSYNGFLIRMMAYVATASAFFNNTPLVAMLMPYTFNWGKKHNVPASKLLIPLSYAAILGGAATLVGTSTNLIVGGLVTDTNKLIDKGNIKVNGAVLENKLPELEIFDFTIVGGIMIVVGIVYILLLGKHLLPVRRGAMSNFKDSTREYVVETIVSVNSPLIDKSVEEGDLRNLKGLFLIEIIRNELAISPVSPEMIIEKGDHLIFAGDTSTVAELISSNYGLRLPKEIELIDSENIGVIEAVVPFNSEIIGRTVKDTNFRGKYDASILAIHRNGEHLAGKIGDISLKAGDLLLLVGGKEVYKRTEGYNVFYILSQVKKINKKSDKVVPLVFIGSGISILLSALHLVPLFQSLFVLFTILLLTRVLTISQIKRSTRFNILIIMALGLSLGKAMMKTGTAEMIANYVVDGLFPFGIVAILFGLYFVTNILAGYMTNVAAVSIVFPIAISTAISLNMDTMPFILLVAFASSANFFTPIGYQTNLMVYSPGAYTFKDYFIATVILAGLITVFVLHKL